MDYGKLTLFNMMQTKMAYLSERQDILSQNVANADTPGYKARDLKPLNFEHLAMMEAHRLHMRQTSALHLRSKPTLDDEFRSEKSRKTFETTPVKNNVALEEQMAKVNETAMNYQETTNLYTKTAAMFKKAIGEH